MVKITTYEFIEKVKLVHKNKYDYSQTIYYGRRNLVNIICKEHGIFKQKAGNHINGQGCPKCNSKGIGNNNRFIISAKRKHGDKYDYSLINYFNSKTKIKIICPEHDIFEQTPNMHLSGYGCPDCDTRVKNYNDFILKANKIHNNKYDYSKSKYLKSNKKILIICLEHGVFEQTPNSHLTGRGCPNCCISKGELFISNWLNQNKIDFMVQKSFSDCRNSLPLRYDFYLPDKNILIEYDGEQHFKEIEYLGGKIKFEYLLQNDKIKTEYAIKKGYNLLRIPYTERNNLSEVLKNNINI